MIRTKLQEQLRFIKEDLINKILEQQYPPGSYFPSEKMLIDIYK